MKRLIRVVTYHEQSERETTADMWKTEGVAAMGFSRVGDLRGLNSDRIRELVVRHYSTRRRGRVEIRRSQDSINRVVTDLLWFRDEVTLKALILAYQCDNLVALVGEVEDGYVYNTNNRVGRLSESWPRYPHQVKVSWWNKPKFHRRRFSRTILPRLEKWVARPGTIYFEDFEDSQIDTLKRQLRQDDSEEASRC